MLHMNMQSTFLAVGNISSLGPCCHTIKKKNNQKQTPGHYDSLSKM